MCKPLFGKVWKAVNRGHGVKSSSAVTRGMTSRVEQTILTACFEKAQPFGPGLQFYGDSFKSVIRVLTAEQRKTLMSKMAPEHRTRLPLLMPDDEAAALSKAVPLSLVQ